MFEGQPRSMPESTDEGMSAVKVAADWECEWWTEHSVPGPRHAAPVSVSAKAIKEIQLVPLDIRVYVSIMYATGSLTIMWRWPPG